MGASPIGDNMLGRVHRPLRAETIAQRRHRQVADVVTGQLQGALAADPGLGIVRERRQAIQFLKYAQEKLGGVDTLEAAEGLVMLIKAADDQF